MSPPPPHPASRARLGARSISAALAALLLLSIALALGCRDDGGPSDTCGDATIGRTEQCETGDLDGATCESLGFDGGTLDCSDACRFDTSACIRCGDNVQQAGEQCDTFDLGGESCLSLGYASGDLACTAACELDASACIEADPALCGNDVLDPGEECEPGLTEACNDRCLITLEPWLEPTVPYDPTCAGGCDETPIELGHLRDGFTLRIDPNVDDAVAQWGDCVESMLVCLEAGSSARACVAAAECPEICKDLFDARAIGVSDEARLLDHFESVFIEEGAACRPVEPVQP